MYCRWSKTAIECYKIGAVCSKCMLVPEDLKHKCRMKKTIISLVKDFGRPIDRINE